MSNSSSSPARETPHIQVNSGQGNLLSTGAFSNSPQGAQRSQSSRSLVPQRPQTSSSLKTRPLHTPLYSNGPADSAELLLPPSRQRPRRFRDEDSVSNSPIEPPSRRSSWGSEPYRDSRPYPINPFEDSRSPSRAGSDDDNINTQTVAEKYNIQPSAGLLLFPEDIENDDYLHNPDADDQDKRECDIFTKRGMVNVGGLGFIVVGILVLFIGYPILYVPSSPSRSGRP